MTPQEVVLLAEEIVNALDLEFSFTEPGDRSTALNLVERTLMDGLYVEDEDDSYEDQYEFDDVEQILSRYE